jgi:hypothetical protein
MKTALVTNAGFQPFTFSVTVETREEAEILRTLCLESRVLAEAIDNHSTTHVDTDTANTILEELGSYANASLSR